MFHGAKISPFWIASFTSFTSIRLNQTLINSSLCSSLIHIGKLVLPKAFSDSQCFALSSALVSVYPMPRWIASFTSFASIRLDKLVLPKASLDSQCFALSSALVSVYPKPFQQQTKFAVVLYSFSPAYTSKLVTLP